LGLPDWSYCFAFSITYQPDQTVDVLVTVLLDLFYSHKLCLYLMASSRGLRVPRVDYAALEAGLIDQSAENASAELDLVSRSPGNDNEQIHSSLERSPENLRAALAEALSENSRLSHQREVQLLEQELAELKVANDRLRQGLQNTRDPPPGRSRLPRHITVDDVRANQEVIAHVDEQIKQLGLTDSSSEDEEDVFTRLGRRSGKGKTLRSGKAVKLTSRVVCPQIWPHSELSLLYVSKDLCYDNLSMAEFVAGYASILRLPCLSSTERSARIDHLASLMYFATQFSWPLVRSLHAAVLFEIECGRLRWGDSFTQVENRVLHNSSLKVTGNARSSPSTHFCRAYQTGKCTVSGDHFGLIKNERKWVQHVCAKCWLKQHEIRRHAETSAECPLRSGELSSPGNN